MFMIIDEIIDHIPRASVGVTKVYYGVTGDSFDFDSMMQEGYPTAWLRPRPGRFWW